MKTLKKVLIIEDEESLSTVLADKIRAEGVEVLTAKDGKIGLETALKEHPDLIWLDFMLPTMNGIELTKELRKDPWGKTACVILLTQVYDSIVIAAAVENGVYKYFIKADHDVADIITETKSYFAEYNK